MWRLTATIRPWGWCSKTFLPASLRPLINFETTRQLIAFFLRQGRAVPHTALLELTSSVPCSRPIPVSFAKPVIAGVVWTTSRMPTVSEARFQ